METPNNQGSHEDILDRTGIMEGSEITIEDTPTEDKPAEKPKEDNPAKPEEGDEEDPKKDEPKGKDDDEPVKPNRPTNSERPLKALFAQIREIRAEMAEIKNLQTPAAQKEIAIVDDALKAIAEKHNLDPEGLSEITKVLESSIMKSLQEKGKLTVDPDVKKRLEQLDAILSERRESQEIAHFQNEWSGLVPEIQKEFPNAPANLIEEARKLMDNISHSKEGVILNAKGEVVAVRDLDYLFYKNKEKFAAILKVAKAQKGVENASKDVDIPDEDENNDIDLDPENIDPEKMARYQKRKLKSPKSDFQVMN